MKILVVGSLIVDVTGYAPRFSAPGETVLGTSIRLGPGGKGNNQATAAARAGGDVRMIGRIGTDALSAIIREHYRAEGLSTRYITVSETAETGVALIEVDGGSGENRIVVVKGANDELSAENVREAEPDFADCSLLLTQLETSVSSIREAVALAKRHGKPVLMNPAPYQSVPDDLFEGVAYLTPNETEAEFFSGIRVDTLEDAKRASAALIKRGVQRVIVTLGKRGAYCYDGREERFAPGVPVEAVDTTGAGDAFNGGLAVAVSEGMPIDTALRFANCVAAISVTRRGTAPAMPRREEVVALLAAHYGIAL